MIGAVFLAFGTLFPIVNPISTTFVFNTLTGHTKQRFRNRIALIACATMIITLFLFLFFGRYLLSFFGVTVYAFRVAGGLYLGKIAFNMLSKEFYKKATYVPHPDESIAVMPLGIPLLSGPGAMTATLVLAESATFSGHLAIALAIVCMAVVSFLAFRYSYVLGRFGGENGAHVFERIMGLLVLVIAAQFVFNGVTGYIATLA